MRIAIRFQFPQSERVNCNSYRACRRQTRFVLSVSTIGTSELQRNGRSVSRCARNNFQFPQSERVNCNQLQLMLHNADIFIFQFPQSERVNCNFACTHVTAITSAFQFPQSERVNCNWVRSSARISDSQLSVSTIGTSELQLVLQRTHRNPHAILSVSTIGTSELQLARGSSKISSALRFQFPQSERVNCNAQKRLLADSSRGLSVSTIGTSELQL